MRLMPTTGPRALTTTTRTIPSLPCRSSHLSPKEYVSIEEVFDAYFACRKTKRNKNTALRFEMDYELNCYKLWEELNNKTYKIGESTAFCVKYPKVREVFAADFVDRIVHHLIINRFNDLFESEMVDTSFACRKGRGSMYGSLKVQEMMKNLGGDAWYAKCDVQSFFMTIDKQILLGEIERILDGANIENKEWWLWLIYKVVLHKPERDCRIHGNRKLWQHLSKKKSLFFSGNKGLPIGNLTSQVFANVYMSIFDRWVTSRLGGEGCYARYVDDFLIIHKDSNVVKKLVKDCDKWLKCNLKLKLHPKKITIQQVHKGNIEMAS